MNDESVFETSQEHLDQFDFDSDEWSKAKNLKRYANSIGLFMMYFSSFEHDFDLMLSDLIHDGSHAYAYLFTKDLELSNKIDLFYAIALTMAADSTHAPKLLKELDAIVKKLRLISTARNKIAHARWTTLDKNGFVRVDVKLDKDNGMVKLRKYRITPLAMRQWITAMKRILNELDKFTERLMAI